MISLTTSEAPDCDVANGPQTSVNTMVLRIVHHTRHEPSPLNIRVSIAATFRRGALALALRTRKAEHGRSGHVLQYYSSSNSLMSV